MMNNKRGGELMVKEQMMTLASLRNRVRMTQAEVANEIGVTKETIIRWERDSSNMPVKYMYIFSDLYKYPMNGIFFGDSIAFSDSLKKSEEVK